MNYIPAIHIKDKLNFKRLDTETAKLKHVCARTYTNKYGIRKETRKATKILRGTNNNKKKKYKLAKYG